MKPKRYQPWTGTLRLSDEDTETLLWLSTKWGGDKVRGLPFSDVIRRALRNERARLEITQAKEHTNA
jgi:hypothetical protein